MKGKPGSVPGFFLTGTRQTVDVLNAAGEGNAFLQYDVFHMQIMEGDLAKSLERLRARIGHIQIAAVPDRHEPGTGEVNFDFLLPYLDAMVPDPRGCVWLSNAQVHQRAITGTVVDQYARHRQVLSALDDACKRPLVQRTFGCRRAEA